MNRLLNVERIQPVHQVIKGIARLGGLAALTFGDADGRPDGIASVSDEFGVSFQDGHVER